jgi:hypothetical protein
MRLTDRIKRWWKPAQWQEDHPMSEQERADPSRHVEDELIHGQHGTGGDSYDRIDVDRDFRKP